MNKYLSDVREGRERRIKEAREQGRIEKRGKEEQVKEIEEENRTGRSDDVIGLKKGKMLRERRRGERKGRKEKREHEKGRRGNIGRCGSD